MHEDLIAEAITRSQSQESKDFHRLRNIQAEGAFANLKEVLKFKKLYSVGLTSAQKRFVLGCAVINLKKLLRFWRHLWQICIRELQIFNKQILNVRILVA